MRPGNYLRVPLKARSLQNLALDEVPPRADFGRDDPCPGSLDISFDLPLGDAEIALMCEGTITFLPDDPPGLPAHPDDVREANVPGWNLKGSLVLTALDDSLPRALQTDVPLLRFGPTLVRYEKVRLTRAFLFQTFWQLYFRNAPPATRLAVDEDLVPLPDPSSPPGFDDPLWFRQVLLDFLNGRLSMPFRLDPADPAGDLLEVPMPVVARPASGPRLTLNIALAAAAARESLDARWWSTAAYDVAGLASPLELVSSDLDSTQHRLYNPRHPANSIIPTHLIFALVADNAWPATDAAHPIRLAARQARPDGSTWRRFDVARPDFPGEPVTARPRRTFPLFQLAWRKGAGPASGVRLPFNGTAYLPLIDAAYEVWITPRDKPADPANAVRALELGRKDPAKWYLDLPSPSITVDFAGRDREGAFAHAHPFDSARIWDTWKVRPTGHVSYRTAANTHWGIPEAREWHTPTRAPDEFGQIYGWIAASAGRHDLAPEFLQAVIYGEGVAQVIDAVALGGSPFDPEQAINSFDFAGLDLIVYRLGMNALPPPAGAPSPAEFTFNLESNGYIDASFKARLTVLPPILRAGEAGPSLLLEPANIAGWEAAIELVAAELHARKVEVLTMLGAAPTEDQIRYLTYIRYLSQPATTQAHAANIATELRAWSGPKDESLTAAGRRYRSLLRLSVAEWLEKMGVYR